MAEGEAAAVAATIDPAASAAAPAIEPNSSDSWHACGEQQFPWSRRRRASTVPSPVLEAPTQDPADPHVAEDGQASTEQLGPIVEDHADGGQAFPMDDGIGAVLAGIRAINSTFQAGQPTGKLEDSAGHKAAAPSNKDFSGTGVQPAMKYIPRTASAGESSLSSLRRNMAVPRGTFERCTTSQVTEMVAQTETALRQEIDNLRGALMEMHDLCCKQQQEADAAVRVYEDVKVLGGRVDRLEDICQTDMSSTGSQMDELVNRVLERLAAERAAILGVAPDVEGADAGDRTPLTEYPITAMYQSEIDTLKFELQSFRQEYEDDKLAHSQDDVSSHAHAEIDRCARVFEDEREKRSSEFKELRDALVSHTRIDGNGIASRIQELTESLRCERQVRQAQQAQSEELHTRVVNELHASMDAAVEALRDAATTSSNELREELKERIESVEAQLRAVQAAGEAVGAVAAGEPAAETNSSRRSKVSRPSSYRQPSVSLAVPVTSQALPPHVTPRSLSLVVQRTSPRLSSSVGPSCVGPPPIMGQSCVGPPPSVGPSCVAPPPITPKGLTSPVVVPTNSSQPMPCTTQPHSITASMSHMPIGGSVTHVPMNGSACHMAISAPASFTAPVSHAPLTGSHVPLTAPGSHVPVINGSMSHVPTQKKTVEEDKGSPRLALKEMKCMFGNTTLDIEQESKVPDAHHELDATKISTTPSSNDMTGIVYETQMCKSQKLVTDGPFHCASFSGVAVPQPVLFHYTSGISGTRRSSSPPMSRVPWSRPRHGSPVKLAHHGGA